MVKSGLESSRSGEKPALLRRQPRSPARQHIKDESVGLIYLDPPFNSRQDYNELFAEKDGTRANRQRVAALSDFFSSSPNTTAGRTA